MNIFRITKMNLIIGVCTLWGFGCWEQTEHEYDSNDDASSETETSADTATASDSVEPSSDEGTDSSLDSSSEQRNSVLAEGWGGFGSACEEESQCSGYPLVNKRCLFNVMGLVDSPGGYCTACCNEAGEDECGPNVDCVGATNSFLICLERCKTDADCRTEEHYECHEGLYYMETTFTGKYCLPSSEYSVVPAGEAPQATSCPWPW